VTVYEHLPVLGDEVTTAFDFGRPSLVIDGTLGLGGHTERLLKRYPDMRILGLDWDAGALATACERLQEFGDRFEGVEANYADLPLIMSHRGRGMTSPPTGGGVIDGLLLDLGLSSRQLLDTDRGFSFLRPGPLDMRMSRSLTMNAWQVLNSSSESELADIFRTYGEEPQSRKIARALKESLKKNILPNDAWQVAETIRRTVSSPQHRIDPATRCFQALRIVVNQELSNVDSILGSLKNLLVSGGRAVIISFHSLEDRRVKVAFHRAAKGCVCPPRIPQCICGQVSWGKLVNKKVVTASDAETQTNPRARSAKMRILEKL
jgi:16S rRNA (cytosine1402-N4)-methyltransferase